MYKFNNAKSCPFCGKTPFLVSQKYHFYRYEYSVGCENEECPVMPCTDFYEDNKDIAIAKWEKRTKECVCYDIDPETGKEINHMYLQEDRPEKIYADGSIDHYCDRRDHWRIL